MLEFCLIARTPSGELYAVTAADGVDAEAFQRQYQRAGFTVERVPTEQARRVVRVEGLARVRGWVP